MKIKLFCPNININLSHLKQLSIFTFNSSWVVETNSPINMTKPAADTQSQYIEANYYPGDKNIIPHKIQFQYWWAGVGDENSEFIVELEYKNQAGRIEAFRGGGYVRDRAYVVTIPEQFRSGPVSRVKAFVKFPNQNKVNKNFDHIKIIEYSIKR